MLWWRRFWHSEEYVAREVLARYDTSNELVDELPEPTSPTPNRKVLRYKRRNHAIESTYTKPMGGHEA